MIRRANASDLDDLLTLFANTIRFINSRDYNPPQIEAWLSSIHDRDRWLDKIKNQYFILFQEEGLVLGFASLDQGRYIDLFYVHKDWQGKGIGSQLLRYLETVALNHSGPHPVLYSDVSKTALPFFQKKGFLMEKKNEINLRGIGLYNFRMKKEIRTV